MAKDLFQKIIPKERNTKEAPLKRLFTITDLIFASGMTLMVLTIELPAVNEEMSDSEVTSELLLQVKNMFIYLITFIIMAIYWVKNVDQSRYLCKTSTQHLMYSLIYFAFILLLPFANQMMSVFPDNFSIRAFYSIDMFLAGIFSFFAWSYASNDHRLIQMDVDHETIKSVKIDILTEPLIGLLAMLMAFFKPMLWDITFLAIPLAFFFRNRWIKRKEMKILY
jgi:TMEM175 potassium channel family protein